MRGFWQDVHYAGRSMMSEPGFTLLVVLILAVGIGANVAMFSIVDTVLLTPLPYPESDRLVIGRATFGGRINPYVSAFDYWDYRDSNESFESLAAFSSHARAFTVTGGETPERVSGIEASVDLLRTLRVEPQLGRGFRPEEAQENAPQVVLLSHGYWQRVFGGERDVLGRPLTIDGMPHTVIGVMPAGFHFFSDVDLWCPMRPDSAYIGERRFHNWLTVGRLRPGVTVAEAQREVDVISARLAAEYPESNKNKALLLTEYREMRVENSRTRLLLLMAAVGLVLLITCSNVAGLLLARGSARSGEMSVRAALGATGARLVRQLLTESVVLALVAGSLGTLLAVWLRDLCAEYLIAQLMATELPRTGGSGLPVSALIFALGASLFTGLLFGIVPALRASRGDVIDGLRAGVTTTDAAGTRFRGGLVVGQVAISMILLIGAGLLMRSLTRLMAVEPGFATSNLLTAQIDLPEADYTEREKRIQFYTSLRDSLLAIPGVESVALANMLPFRNASGTTYVYAEESPPVNFGDAPSAYDRAVFPGYFEAMGIPLLAGRALEMTDRSGTGPVTVVSQALAQRHFPNENPIGRKIVVDLGQPVTVEIVGVVGDLHEESLRIDWSDAFYISYLNRPFFTMRLAVRTAVEPASVTAALRDAVWSLDRNLPVADVAAMDTLLWRSLARSRVTTFALTTLAIVALMLAITGLYAVLAYYVVRRRREIAIRIALGADAETVVRLVLKRGLLLTAVGVIVGLAGAVGLTRLIEELLYGVEPTDTLTFGLVGLVFTLVAVLACLLPAWRALRIDPISVLRAE